MIRIIDEDQQYSIMVDCGQFTQPVNDYVRDVLHKHINILVVTHIDGDHIVGVIKLLKEIPDLQIDNIWFNAYRRNDNGAVVELTEQQKAIISWIKKELPVEFDAINYRREVSALQGKSLSKSIIENNDWLRVWNTEYITKDTEDFDLPDGFGKIVFLSPTKEAMAAIDIKFKDAFNKYFMNEWNESIENREEISELLLRLTEAYKTKVEIRTVSGDREIFNADFILKQAKIESKDKSETNLASIAFMLECGNHRIAMLGDAYAQTIEDSLFDKYKDKGIPLECDAIKVSHHGSNGNSSKSLLEKIQASSYFIPGGKGDDYPSWGAFGRIAQSKAGMKTVVFSHCCDMSKKIDGIDGDVKQTLMVETAISESEYELFEW